VPDGSVPVAGPAAARSPGCELVVIGTPAARW